MMSKLMLALGLMLASVNSFAAEDSKVELNAEPNAGYWHCTAYPEGHGHSVGYSYTDRHYNHAYYGAMNRCERITHHHCHDVHCHVDHH